MKAKTHTEQLHPNNSATVFVLKPTPDEDPVAVVLGVFTDILGVNVPVEAAQQTSPREDKSAAKKVELCNVFDKMLVLHNKTKCTESKKYEHGKIRSCETHSNLVNRQSTNQLLKLMGLSDKYVVVSNGLLKSKMEVKNKGEDREGASGGDSLDNNPPSGALSNDDNGNENSEDGKAAASRKKGDDGVHMVAPQPKQPQKDPANQGAPKPPPKKVEPTRKNPSCVSSTSSAQNGLEAEKTPQGGQSQGNSQGGSKKGNKS